MKERSKDFQGFATLRLMNFKSCIFSLLSMLCKYLPISCFNSGNACIYLQNYVNTHFLQWDVSDVYSLLVLLYLKLSSCRACAVIVEEKTWLFDLLVFRLCLFS